MDKQGLCPFEKSKMLMELCGIYILKIRGPVATVVDKTTVSTMKISVQKI